MPEVLIDVPAFDAVSTLAAVELLRPVCASSAWLDAVAAGRPYGSLAALVQMSDSVLAGLTWPNVEQAMAAHPRIGERAQGGERESQWSRQEQAATAGADADVTEALRAGNVAYERRFGHVFLICATGLTPAEMLADLTERLEHDRAVEQRVVRRELAAIVRLRLAKALT